jgi:uncharacterized protein YecT (DUF1311 family)
VAKATKKYKLFITVLKNGAIHEVSNTYGQSLRRVESVPILKYYIMKYIILITLFLFSISCTAFAQQPDWPKEVTPQVLQQIKADVEKEVPKFKQKLLKEYLTADQIEFSIDTFKINSVAAYRTDIDYSTLGMNIATVELADSYDKLLNKYYKKLLKILKPEDKKNLIAAQKAWLSFRNTETKLIGIMTKDEYSGGGSMQSNIANDSRASLIVKRTNDIFNYYYGAIVKGNY